MKINVGPLLEDGAVEVANILQLSHPPVIYRTFLFSENHVTVSRYILGVTGV